MIRIKISPQRSDETSKAVTIDGMKMTIDGTVVDLSKPWDIDDERRVLVPHPRLHSRSEDGDTITVHLLWPYHLPDWGVENPPEFSFSGSEKGKIQLKEKKND